MPSKRYKKALEVVDGKKAYALKDAVGVLAKFPKAKFNETIREALGHDAPRPAGFENIEALPQQFVVMPVDVQKMKQYIAEQTGL